MEYDESGFYYSNADAGVCQGNLTAVVRSKLLGMMVLL